MSGGKNCYPGTDVLVNKYNIRDKKLLERLEIQKVAVKLLGLDVKPEKIEYTYNTAHLVSIHQYLFGDIYEWAGSFRDENLYKEEHVLSGGSAEYADYHKIREKLDALFDSFDHFDWENTPVSGETVSDFLLALWSIHPFREGNTRTCVTFLWHYLRGKGVLFQVEILKNNPMYVRDALVMANYDQKQYLHRIISDALQGDPFTEEYNGSDGAKETYQIAKSDYEAFRRKYSVQK